MSISTFSSFIYGHEITADNKYLDFDEGGGELTAELKIGSYTLTDFLVEVKRAMDAAGALTYTVAADRSTRKITISSTATFSILSTSGSHIGATALTLIGFTGADKTSASTYTGNIASGSIYNPQFILQDYVPSTNHRTFIDPTVNQSSSGEVEVVKFGVIYYVEMNIKYATNNQMDNAVIINSATGYNDLLTFMQYLIRKNKIEFCQDKDEPDTYEELLLESSPGFAKGTGYKLKELYDVGLPNFYETGLLKFRVL